jgi:hypothetical protein
MPSARLEIAACMQRGLKWTAVAAHGAPGKTASCDGIESGLEEDWFMRQICRLYGFGVLCVCAINQ